MKKKYRHIKVYDDVLCLYKLYMQTHQHLPKSFRFTTGEHILNEITLCLKHITKVNYMVKHNAKGVELIFYGLFESVEVIRAFITLGWDLAYISHNRASELSDLLETIAKQLHGWLRWCRPSVCGSDGAGFGVGGV